MKKMDNFINIEDDFKSPSPMNQGNFNSSNIPGLNYSDKEEISNISMKRIKDMKDQSFLFDSDSVVTF